MAAEREAIRTKIAAALFVFREHPALQSLRREIEEAEFREAIRNGTVIEDYPDDKYGPSRSICGFTLSRRPLPIQCSYATRPTVKIITVYEPDARIWSDHFTKRASTTDDNPT